MSKIFAVRGLKVMLVAEVISAAEEIFKASPIEEHNKESRSQKYFRFHVLEIVLIS